MFNNFTMVSAFPETGRTHQIRVHFQYIGHPLVGDPEYGNNLGSPTNIIGQALHSYRLSFQHPITGEQMDFSAPMPQDMEELLEEIENL
jgi:23S rRNA pseudouridine1911/1915/1917 synthase